jgi:hypothetical protein
MDALLPILTGQLGNELKNHLFEHRR